MNKWRRIDQRREERQFKAQCRCIYAMRSARAAVVSAVTTAQIRMIACAPASDGIGLKVVALANATLQGIEAIRLAMEWRKDFCP